MKKIFHLGIVLAFLLALVPVGVSADPISIPLLAGQDIEVGSVHVSNNESSLIIEYEITDPD